MNSDIKFTEEFEIWHLFSRSTIKKMLWTEPKDYTVKKGNSE